MKRNLESINSLPTAVTTMRHSFHEDVIGIYILCRMWPQSSSPHQRQETLNISYNAQEGDTKKLYTCQHNFTLYNQQNSQRGQEFNYYSTFSLPSLVFCACRTKVYKNELRLTSRRKTSSHKGQGMGKIKNVIKLSKLYMKKIGFDKLTMVV